MSTELCNITNDPSAITRAMSQDPEYDDALEVPDSIEITVDDNGEAVHIQEKQAEYIDNKGIQFMLHSITLSFIFVFIFPMINII